MSLNDLPIGVFDSGVGGLTVLTALRRRLPDENLLYLGDMARLPYGTKTGETIAHYALQAAEKLVSSGIKLLVVACNTASVHALPALAARYPLLPVVGVVEPGAAAACAQSPAGRIAVIATESTIRSEAYVRAIHRIRPDAEVSTQACSLMVSLAEEGWTSGPIAEAVAERYLRPIFAAAQPPDTLLLGCTHFPLLRDTIASRIGKAVTLVDSGTNTAEIVARRLADMALAREHGRAPSRRFLATDGRERFARLATLFLGEALAQDEVELVDLQTAEALKDRVRAGLPARS